MDYNSKFVVDYDELVGFLVELEDKGIVVLEVIGCFCLWLKEIIENCNWNKKVLSVICDIDKML